MGFLKYTVKKKKKQKINKKCRCYQNKDIVVNDINCILCYINPEYRFDYFIFLFLWSFFFSS
mgnify:CR=1 FL=1